MSIEEQKFLLEIKILLQKGNPFVARRDIFKLLEKAEKINADGFKLLYEALKPIYQQEVPKIIASSPSGSEPLECNMCGKIFKNGVNSWKGGKRACKLSCTQNNLVPCQQ